MFLMANVSCRSLFVKWTMKPLLDSLGQSLTSPVRLFSSLASASARLLKPGKRILGCNTVSITEFCHDRLRGQPHPRPGRAVVVVQGAAWNLQQYQYEKR